MDPHCLGAPCFAMRMRTLKAVPAAHEVAAPAARPNNSKKLLWKAQAQVLM